MKEDDEENRPLNIFLSDIKRRLHTNKKELREYA